MRDASQALAKLERFSTLIEAAQADQEVNRPRLPSDTPPNPEAVAKAKHWEGKKSQQEINKLAAELAPVAEFYRCSEGGRYFSRAGDNWSVCLGNGDPYEAMMLRRSVSELRPKLVAATWSTDKAGEQSHPKNKRKTKPTAKTREIIDLMKNELDNDTIAERTGESADNIRQIRSRLERDEYDI